MRSTLNFNSHWQFTKPGTAPVAVTLPHTWNAADGTDGGNDYFRGICTYTKEFAAPAHADDEEVWLEFEGAAMTAVVTLNDQELTRHAGGYSTFRVNLTPALAAQNTLTVTVDNSANRTVYPQKADFTFYGGIYRDVHILIVPHSHFALGNHGAPALRVTPEVSDDLHSAAVTVEAACENTSDGTEVLFAIEGVGEQTAAVQDGKAVTVFYMENVHLWDGVADPYLYSIAASLPGGDAVAVHFGCRKIAFKPDTGFWLNGRNVRLVGAARHQDRAGLGNALTAAEHEEDMQILRDMGANTVRLAHYQHAQYFYDLCDKYGLVAWAEIPYITEHMPEATANTLSQMEELVLQNYNHPSIICWGLSNEITVTTGVTENLTANHRLLNDLCHRLDATRPTTMAHAFMLDPNDPFVQLPIFAVIISTTAGTWVNCSRTMNFLTRSTRTTPTASSVCRSSARTQTPPIRAPARSAATGRKATKPSTTSICSKCGRSAPTSGRCTSGTASTSARTVAVRAASPVKTRRVL